MHVIPGEVEPRSFADAPSDRVVKSHLALSRRAGASNAVDYAKISDPKQECTPYGDNAVTEMKNKKDFPTPSQIASIVQNDKEANSVWSDIKKSGIIPSEVKPKPQQGNDHMGVSSQGYNAQQDPDCWWTANQCVKPKHKGLPMDLASCPEPDTWGLTFDDGPNCTHNGFYDFLSKNKLKATLFYIGSNVVNWPYQAQRAIMDGHDICVHTWSHHYMTTLEDDQVFAELYYTAKVIKQITGVTPTCWRPPFGDTDDRVRAIAYGLGLRTILWEEDTNDWQIQPYPQGKSTQEIDQNYQKILDKSKSESPIVLTHEINAHTMKEFQKMYPKIKDAYKNVVPLTACQNVTKPYADSDIEYPAFSDFANGKIQPSNLPSGDSLKVDANAKYQPKTLNDTSNGYGHPQSGSSSNSKSSGGSGNSGNSGNSNKSAKGNGAAALSTSQASTLALTGAAALSLLALL
ncbi:hypothetical protein MOBT1_001083 [Malassezia obtusa]|uniref:chitin deacetylase n=1 Tax=Malassezia obtusa TaxID=76774 RepID=A0AAF0DY95_9BASI|nr:hypothetical protein MOBT1_001083 [Malassezia obtusa]